MSEQDYKPRIPDIFEAAFDLTYLLFDLVAGITFFTMAHGRTLFILYGILTFTLLGGDAFHLVPRMRKAMHGSSEIVKRQMGIGLQISSITMTIFYVLYIYIWRTTFPELQPIRSLELIIWISAIARILICLLPQNRWTSDEGNMKLSLFRNGLFLITGIGVILLYAISGNTRGYQMNRMIAAIIISFGCYIPVTLFSKKKPMIGMLMIPKTCAYIWMILMGLQILFS